MRRSDRRGAGGLRAGPGSVLGALVLTLLLSAGPDSPVADAAMRGDVDAVRTLLEQGADPNVPQGDGMTALHWAAEAGDGALVDLLLEAGADVSAVTRLGAYTPLHLASRVGEGAVVGRLLEAGADPSARTTTGGVTALHLAAGAGSDVVVEALLEHGAEVDALEEEWGQTPLVFAAAGGHTGTARLLVDRGADLAHTTRVVRVPQRVQADRARESRRNEVLAEMKERDGGGETWSPTPEQVQEAVRAAREVELVPEEAPAERAPDFEEAHPEPLSYGELVGAHGGLTALLHAVREGHVETTTALLEAGAELDQPSAGDRTTPLLMAVLNGHFDLAMQLLERGADPTLASDAGATPLYAALNTQWAPKARYPQQQAYQQQRTTYLELMGALLEAGADPNVRLEKHLWYMSYTFDLLGVDTKGATPFWRAAYATDVEAMRLLVAHGADPHVPTAKVPERRRGDDEEGADPSGLPPVPVGGPAVWPLHAASGVGYGEGYAGNAHRHVPDGWLPAVKYLVEELGADVNARDHNGYNAVHHAAARGDNELILYLVEKGADPTAVSRSGQTTVDMANGPVQRIPPFPETIELLEGMGAKNNHDCQSC